MKGSDAALIGGVLVIGGVAAYLIATKKSSGQTTTGTGTTPANVYLTGPSTALPGSSITLTANVTDANNNPVPNYTVYLNEITTGGTANATTDSNGNANFQVSFPQNASGQYQFQAYVEV